MAGKFSGRLMLIGLIFFSCPFTGFGKNNKPSPFFQFNQGRMRLVADTLPANKKGNDETAGIKQNELIKQVPKSRKQVKPINVPAAISVKPIQVIKPKIIKPVIKIN